MSSRNRRTSRFPLRLLPVLATSTLLAAPLAAQEFLTKPWDSPACTVAQTIGITDVTVTAGRPGVKGRVVWGELVPWNEVWRAGANMNTTVTFDDDVKVEGHELGAGTYGLHMIPHKDAKWTVIFSTNSTSWGSYHYDEKEDALRVDVMPVEAPFTEWLSYEFTDLADDHATLQLHWEKLAVPLKLSVDTDTLVLANARDNYLRGRSGFYWQAWDNAAKYCLSKKTHLEEGLEFAKKSVAMQAGFGNLTTEAGLLAALGKTDEANAAKEQAMAVASEADLNALGYQYLQGGKLDDAIALFRKLTEKFPTSWNACDSLAEAYAKKGDKAQAIQFYGKALSMGPDETSKARIQGELKKLGG
jgi:predicted negative regulator of RcsB-dependent stress response